MENRRESYRLRFGPRDRLPVELSAGPNTVRGELLDLSLEGMQVRIAGAQMPPPDGRCRVQLDLDAGAPLRLAAEIVYRKDEAGACYGLHFLPSAEVGTRAAQERRLFRFLLDEQRRSRRGS